MCLTKLYPFKYNSFINIKSILLVNKCNANDVENAIRTMSFTEK